VTAVLRFAEAGEVDVLVALINAAYVAEAFFKIGDRTDAAEVGERLQKHCFIVAEDAGAVIGCVYVAVHGDRGYFGMLSVHPERQGAAIGRALVAAAEEHCGAVGCTHMDLDVVNLRTELIPWYGRLGYTQVGTAPFPQPERASRECHMVVMSKALGRVGAPAATVRLVDA
jgi:ribosomal protein S18 acetylase RimI-like enzyme